MRDLHGYSKDCMYALQHRIVRALDRHAVPLRARRGLVSQIASDLLGSQGFTWDEALYSPEVSDELDRMVDQFLSEADEQLTLNFDRLPRNETADGTVSRSPASEPPDTRLPGAQSRAVPDRSRLRVAESIFSLVELFVPSRISAEEIGDALEVLDDLAADCAPSWKLHLKIASTVFWLGVNVVREIVTAALGKRPA